MGNAVDGGTANANANGPMAMSGEGTDTASTTSITTEGCAERLSLADAPDRPKEGTEAGAPPIPEPIVAAGMPTASYEGNGSGSETDTPPDVAGFQRRHQRADADGDDDARAPAVDAEFYAVHPGTVADIVPRAERPVRDEELRRARDGDRRPATAFAAAIPWAELVGRFSVVDSVAGPHRTAHAEFLHGLLSEVRVPSDEADDAIAYALRGREPARGGCAVVAEDASDPVSALRRSIDASPGDGPLTVVVVHSAQSGIRSFPSGLYAVRAARRSVRALLAAGSALVSGPRAVTLAVIGADLPGLVGYGERDEGLQEEDALGGEQQADGPRFRFCPLFAAALPGRAQWKRGFRAACGLSEFVRASAAPWMHGDVCDGVPMLMCDARDPPSWGLVDAAAAHSGNAVEGPVAE